MKHDRMHETAQLRGKAKDVSVFNQAPRHEDVRGNGGITPRILILGTRWMWVVSFTSRPPYSLCV
jgi:hypothetical protein